MKISYVSRWAILLPLFFAGCVSGAGGGPAKAGLSSDGLSTRIADAMLAAGDAPAALHVAEGRLAIEPSDIEAHLRRARALILLGRSGEAADEYEIVSQQRPADLLTVKALAGARAAAGDTIAAERAWRIVLQHTADDLHAVAGLAIALDLQERHPEAQALYRQILHARPDDRAAAANLGLSLALGGSPQEALTFLERPGVLAQGLRAKHDLAVALVLAGDEAGARTMLAKDMNEEAVTAAISAIKELRKGKA